AGRPHTKVPKNPPPGRTEPPAPPSPTPGASPAPRNEKRRRAPAPQRRPDDSAPLLAEARGEKLAVDGASLLAVKKVHVDPFGDDSIGKQFRDQLTSALRANRRFTLTVNRDEADAGLKGKIKTTRP